MITLLAGLMMSVTLAPPFGGAQATAVEVGSGLRLEVVVEVSAPAIAVLVRGIGDGGSALPPVALSDRGDGTWSGIVDLPVAENIRIGFELIPESGPATVSGLHTLVELGVDVAVFRLGVPAPEVGAEPEEPRVRRPGSSWGWLALAAGAGALTLLVVWVAGRSPDDETEDVDDPPGMAG